MMKRSTLVLAVVLYFLAVVPTHRPVSAKDTWLSVRSNNFFLVGNASEKEIRQVAARLEQFRDVFSRLFPGMRFTSPVPTTVIVFKSDSSYKPFKPLADGKVVSVSGYFQPGREENHITLTSEKREENPYRIIFHEYVHLLVNNSLGKTSVPPWFNEEFDNQMKIAPISEAVALAYLGDLLYHIRRPEEATAILKQALSLDQSLPMANSSLGMVLMEQKKFSEAKEHLRRAVAESSSNYLAHYYHAYALSRESMTEGKPVFGFPDEAVRTMRAALHKAIELKPDFPESYHLLAFVNLVTNVQIDESIALIKRAVALSPGSEEFLFVLAQLYIRKENFVEAAKIVRPLAATGADPNIRAGAQSFLASINTIQEQMARARAAGDEHTSEPPNRPVLNVDATGPTTTTEKTNPSSYLRDALRKPAEGELQVEGILLRIECAARAITFVVRVGNRLLKLKTDSFENIDITTFSADVAGEISCGQRKTADGVVVCYLPGSDARSKTDGLLRSVEFVPKDFKLKP